MGITRLGKSQMGSRRTARRNKKKFEDQRRADHLLKHGTGGVTKARIAALRAEREAEREEEKKIFKQKQLQRAFNSARAEMIQKVTNSKTIAKMSARQKREVAKRTEVLRLSYFGLKEQVEEEERAQARAARRAARKRR